MSWQLAHVAFDRCSPNRSRKDSVFEIVFSFSGGKFGGGGGGGAPNRFPRIQFPRITGEVRVAYDVTASTLPCRNNPPRCASGFNAEVRVTRDGHTVGGTSIMGLMMLGAGQGQTILIETEGTEAKAAMEALILLVESGFGEGD